jgi:predicted DNA-binding transcriptional regulator YafY
MVFCGCEPTALRWAGINDAVGVRSVSVHGDYKLIGGWALRVSGGRGRMGDVMATPKRLGASRATLERMHRIHQLIQNREYPNCTKLAKEFEVAKRTMKRDIEFMKDRMSLPIGFDVQRNGYFYTEKVERFPELPMSEAEVFALFVASKAIEQYRGTPFQRLLETAFRRLTGRLDEHVKFSMGSLDSVISFRPFAPGDADLRAFETLARGVRERRAVKFMYRNHAALSFQRRHVHPYQMAHVDGPRLTPGAYSARSGNRR